MLICGKLFLLFLRWLERVFNCYNSYGTSKDCKEVFLTMQATINDHKYLNTSFVGKYFKAGCDVMAITMATIRSKFQCLPIICKTKSVNHPFYCTFRKLPKILYFSGGMAKSYSVELKLYRKSRVLNYKKFHRITFLQTFLFELAHLMFHACKKTGWVTVQDFEIKTNISCTFCFRFARFCAAFLLPVFCTRDFY